MTAALDPFRSFSAELHTIRRLNSSLYGAHGADGLEPRPHPPAEGVTLAPSRDDVPLLDPCCGQLSAGAEVDLGLKGRSQFVDVHHVASSLWIPPGFRERPRKVSNPSGICVDMSEDKAWNSRRIPAAVLRARLSGKITERFYLPLLQVTPLIYFHSLSLCKLWSGTVCLFWRSQCWLPIGQLPDFHFLTNLGTSLNRSPWALKRHLYYFKCIINHPGN